MKRIYNFLHSQMKFAKQMQEDILMRKKITQQDHDLVSHWRGRYIAYESVLHRLQDIESEYAVREPEFIVHPLAEKKMRKDLNNAVVEALKIERPPFISPNAEDVLELQNAMKVHWVTIKAKNQTISGTTIYSLSDWLKHSNEDETQF